MGYKVKLNVFEGPFDLLVYLIESARMSIYDIKVSEITEQYLDYLDEMGRMDVGISAEFMLLASELIEIKSKMLIPRSSSEGEGFPEEDPRSQLVERLLEYKKFKAISEMLSEEEKRSYHIYEKPQEDISRYTDEPDEFLKLGIDEFVKAFNAFLEKKQKETEIKKRYERVERQKISAEERMKFIRSLFEEDSERVVPFKDIVKDSEDKYDIALSFSSMLEMIRQKSITADQKALFSEIYVKSAQQGE